MEMGEGVGEHSHWRGVGALGSCFRFLEYSVNYTRGDREDECWMFEWWMFELYII